MPSREQFVSMLWPAAVQASQVTGIDPRIIVAQAAQETGWGRSAPGNNYFGIKSHGKGGGQTFKTHEYVNGQRVNVNDSFRQFESPEESVMGYAEFMTKNPRYGPMRQAQGLDAQLQALGQSGYATDPNYAQSVGAIARSLPSPAPLSSEAQQFVNNNPQPGGFGPGIDDPNAPPSAPVAPPFGTMAPMMAGSSGIPADVARYAAAPESKSFGDRLGAFGQAWDQQLPKAPRPGPFPGGPSETQANALLKAALEGTGTAPLFLAKRLRGVA